MGKFIDLTGQRFGRLVVKLLAGKNKYGNLEWLCVCDCGEEKVIKGYRLKNGETTSCGCYHREKMRKDKYKHGHAKKENISKTYRAWQGSKDRCYNVNNERYDSYGGRGIIVCKEWLDPRYGFESFLKDMGVCPDRMSLDRINVNGNYEPGNCRWASQKEQCNNTRKNRWITFQGENRTLMQWSDILKINRSTLSIRIDKYKWSIERAFTTPIFGRDAKLKKNTLIEYKGEIKTVIQWSNITGISIGTIRYRLLHNWSIDRTLSTLGRMV